MLLLNRYLFLIYLIIAALFFGGFCLRIVKLYPGKAEPLILDSSAVVLGIAFACISNALKASGVRFILIFTSSLIIAPHLVYILRKKDI